MPTKPLLNPTTKTILQLLGTGALICSFMVIPGLAHLGKTHLDWKYRRLSDQDLQKLKAYQTNRVKQIFKRLHQQKDISIVTKNGIDTIELTLNGKRKLIRYNLRDLTLHQHSWDGKWRLISYDIPEHHHKARNLLRYTLKHLQCLKLQHSLYLTPYTCESEINFLRESFGVGEYVILITASHIEGESELKRLFSLTQ